MEKEMYQLNAAESWMLPEVFVQYERKLAGGYDREEAIPDSDFNGANNYKILYRTCTALLDPTEKFVSLLGRIIDREESLDYLRRVHSYFAWLFAKPLAVYEFFDTYDFIYDTWWKRKGI